MTRRFPRVRRWRLGYHRRQVDSFLNHVELALTGAMPPPTGTDVRRAGFELVHGGYDVALVDAYLDRVEAEVLDRATLAAKRRGQVDTAGEVRVLLDELADDAGKRFERLGRWHQGYDPGDVDGFLDALVAALAPGGGRVRVEDVRRAVFRASRGGYRCDAVDDTLDRVVELVLVLEQEATGLRAAGPDALRPPRVLPGQPGPAPRRTRT